MISQTPDDKPPFDGIPGRNPGVVVTIPDRSNEDPPLLTVVEFDPAGISTPGSATDPVSASVAAQGLNGPRGMAVLRFNPGP